MKEIYQTRHIVSPTGRQHFGTVTITKRKWHTVRWSVFSLDSLPTLSDCFIGGSHEDGALKSIHTEWHDGVHANAGASSSRQAMFWGSLRWGVAKGVDYSTAIAIKNQVISLWEGRIQKWFQESEEPIMRNLVSE